MSKGTYIPRATPALIGMPPKPRPYSAPLPDPLEAARATCGHGPWYYDSQSGQTCAGCGAAHPGSWTYACLHGGRR